MGPVHVYNIIINHSTVWNKPHQPHDNDLFISWKILSVIRHVEFTTKKVAVIDTSINKWRL